LTLSDPQFTFASNKVLAGNSQTPINLIDCITCSAFASDFWQKAPFRVERSDQTNYRPLFQREDLEAIIKAVAAYSPTEIHLIRRSKNGDVKVNREGAEYRDAEETLATGGSVRVESVERVWPGIRASCNRLQQFFGSPCTANIYWSPYSAQALSKHFDLHDVIVIQVLGSKGWRLFEPPQHIPIQSVPLLAFEYTCRGKGYRRTAADVQRVLYEVAASAVAQEFVIRANDMLYIPRGHIHEAFTTTEESVHLTFGIHSVTVLDLLTVALGQAAHREAWLRQALPAEYHFREDLQMHVVRLLNDNLSNLGDLVDVRSALNELLTSMHEKHHEQSRSDFRTSGRSKVTPDQIVYLRSDIFASTSSQDGRLILKAADRKITLPAIARPVIERLLNGVPIRVRDLLTLADGSLINRVLETLLAEGILSVAAVSEENDLITVCERQGE
jgi:ribosomal protein L16 Arg81 hydroxylase